MRPVVRKWLERARLLLLAAGAGHAAHAAAPANQSAVRITEAQVWQAAREIGTAEAYQRYLQLFPVGSYAEDAFRCIVEQSVGLNSCAIEPAGGAAGVSAAAVAGTLLALY